MRTNPILGPLLDRGIFKAPWQGPQGEWVLLAVKSDHSLAIPPVTVPQGGTLPDVYDDLHRILDHLDPIKLRVVSGALASTAPPTKRAGIRQ